MNFNSILTHYKKFSLADNEAGDGPVDLIKAARNVADDADVVQLPNSTRMATSAAPAEDTELTNKKYVDGSGTDFSALDNDTAGFHTFNTNAGDFILHWEKVSGLSSSDSGPITITFTQAFTKCFQVIACVATNTKTSANIEVFSVTNTGFNINKPATLTAIRYIAIGR